MRILLLAGSYPPEVGGIAEFMHSFVRSLKLRGVETDLIANPKLPDRGYVKRIDVCRWLIRERLKSALYDRVVASSWSPYAVALPDSLPASVPFDIFCHGMDLLEPSRSLRYRLVMKRTLHRASRVLANSEYTARLAKEFGAKDKAVVVVHPGVDVDRFQPAEAPTSGQVVLSLGRLVERKGFDTVLRALKVVIGVLPNIEYWCAGDGPDSARLKSLAEEYGVSANVRWLGEVPDDQKVALYQSATVFVMPNREVDRSVEGFGIVFLEAAACGLPVIGGKSGGTSDAIVDGKTGFLIDGTNVDELAERLIDLFRDESLRKRLGEAGRQMTVNQFKAEEIATPYLDSVAF